MRTYVELLGINKFSNTQHLCVHGKGLLFQCFERVLDSDGGELVSHCSEQFLPLQKPLQLSYTLQSYSHCNIPILQFCWSDKEPRTPQVLLETLLETEFQRGQYLLPELPPGFVSVVPKLWCLDQTQARLVQVLWKCMLGSFLIRSWSSLVSLWLDTNMETLTVWSPVGLTKAHNTLMSTWSFQNLKATFELQSLSWWGIMCLLPTSRIPWHVWRALEERWPELRVAGIMPQKCNWQQRAWGVFAIPYWLLQNLEARLWDLGSITSHNGH